MIAVPHVPVVVLIASPAGEPDHSFAGHLIGYALMADPRPGPDPVLVACVRDGRGNVWNARPELLRRERRDGPTVVRPAPLRPGA